jgi:hypothetical protein
MGWLRGACYGNTSRTSPGDFGRLQGQRSRTVGVCFLPVMGIWPDSDGYTQCSPRVGVQSSVVWGASAHVGAQVGDLL